MVGPILVVLVISAMPASVSSLDSQTAMVTDRHERPSVVVQAVLAHRDALALDAAQVGRLEALVADLRRQESDWYLAAQRQLSSKPWIHGTYVGSAAEARAEAFRVLRPDQRERATELLAEQRPSR